MSRLLPFTDTGGQVKDVDFKTAPDVFNRRAPLQISIGQGITRETKGENGAVFFVFFFFSAHIKLSLIKVMVTV